MHVCQSCGRDIASAADSGTDASGRPIGEYCVACYARGAFTDPTATRGEMVHRHAIALVSTRGLSDADARLNAEHLIPTLDRWTGLASAVSRRWWTLLLRGIAAIIFGILVFTWPGPTALVLTMVFGAYAFVDGIFALVAAFEGGRRAGWLAIAGIFGIIIGVVTFNRPGATMIALYALFAAWAVVTGAFAIFAGIRLRHEIPGEFWLIASGVLSVIFGVLLMALPSTGALAVMWLIGLYGFLYGGIEIALAFRVRRLTHPRERLVPTTPRPA